MKYWLLAPLLFMSSPAVACFMAIDGFGFEIAPDETENWLVYANVPPKLRFGNEVLECKFQKHTADQGVVMPLVHIVALGDAADILATMKMVTGEGNYTSRFLGAQETDAGLSIFAYGLSADDAPDEVLAEVFTPDPSVIRIECTGPMPQAISLIKALKTSGIGEVCTR